MWFVAMQPCGRGYALAAVLTGAGATGAGGAGCLMGALTFAGGPMAATDAAADGARIE